MVAQVLGVGWCKWEQLIMAVTYAQIFHKRGPSISDGQHLAPHAARVMMRVTQLPLYNGQLPLGHTCSSSPARSYWEQEMMSPPV